MRISYLSSYVCSSDLPSWCRRVRFLPGLSGTVEYVRTGAIPFQFDMSEAVARLRRDVGGRIGNVTINLPFVSVDVSPQDRERSVAREVVRSEVRRVGKEGDIRCRSRRSAEN